MAFSRSLTRLRDVLSKAFWWKWSEQTLWLSFTSSNRKFKVLGHFFLLSLSFGILKLWTSVFTCDRSPFLYFLVASNDFFLLILYEEHCFCNFLRHKSTSFCLLTLFTFYAHNFFFFFLFVAACTTANSHIIAYAHNDRYATF